MANKIQFKRGTKANMPTLAVGEPGFATDTEELFIGTSNGNARVGGSEIYEKISVLEASDSYVNDALPIIISALNLSNVEISGVEDEYTTTYGETIELQVSATNEAAITCNSCDDSMVQVVSVEQESGASTATITLRATDTGVSYVDVKATASASGIIPASKRIQININKAEPTITFGNKAVDYRGTAQLEIHSTDPYTGDEYTSDITYTNEDETNVTIDEDGVMTGIHAGTATIGYTVAASRHFQSKSGTVEVTVNKIAPSFRTSPLDLMLGETGYVTPVSTIDDGTVFSFVFRTTSTTYIDVGTSTGKVTTKKIGGPSLIQITSGATENYKSKTFYAQVTVSEFVAGTADPGLIVPESITMEVNESIDVNNLDISSESTGSITYSIPSAYTSYLALTSYNSSTQIRAKDSTNEIDYALVNVSIAATRNYKADTKTIRIIVDKMTPELEITTNPENANVTLDKILLTKGDTVEIDVGSDSTGQITCISSDGTVMAVTSTNGVHTLAAQNTGSASFTIEVAEAGNFKSLTKVIPVEVIPVEHDINSNTKLWILNPNSAGVDYKLQGYHTGDAFLLDGIKLLCKYGDGEFEVYEFGRSKIEQITITQALVDALPTNTTADINAKQAISQYIGQTTYIRGISTTPASNDDAKFCCLTSDGEYQFTGTGGAYSDTLTTEANGLSLAACAVYSRGYVMSGNLFTDTLGVTD